MTDLELLRHYAETGSQEAFAELVSHHGDWIYSAALRMVRRGDWAEDVTQAVFLLLAQRAAKLKPANLNAWLFNVTRYCSLNVLRAENRRQKREKQAAIMNQKSSGPDPDSVWQSVAPILEETVRRLPSDDRDVVLLRFYQRKSLAEVGLALGVSEEAARKRVGKAVQRLRSLLSARGAVVPTVAVASSILAEQTTQAAPADLLGQFAAGKPSAAASHIAKGVNQMLFVLKLKMMAVALLLVAVPSGFWMAIHMASAAQVADSTPPAAVAPNPPIPSAAPAANVVSGDAAVSPFFNSFTLLIASVDMSRIDLNALQVRERDVLLGVLPANDPRRRSLQRMTVALRDSLNHTFTTSTKAGVARLYLVVAGAHGDKDATAFAVYPVDAQTNVPALDADNKEPGIDAANGVLRIYSLKTGAGALIGAMMSQMDTAEPRPELELGLSAGAASALRVVVVPGALDHTTTILRVLGLGDLSDPHLKMVKWCRVGLDTSPTLWATITIGCQDADSAAAMAKNLAEKFAARKAALPSDPLESKIADLLGNLKPTAAGDQVAFTLDQSITEDILAVFYWREIENGRSIIKQSIATIAGPPNPNLPLFSPDQTKALIDMAGKPVTVEGKISQVEDRGRFAVIHFGAPGGFFAVVSRDQSPDAYGYLIGSDGSLLVGKRIRLIDGISLYQGIPFMGIAELRQIELVDDQNTNSPQP